MHRHVCVYICVCLSFLCVCAPNIECVGSSHEIYYIHTVCIFKKRKKNSNGKNLLHCEISLNYDNCKKKNYTGKILVWWKNSLMSGFQFNPRLSSKNQMNKVYHTPQVCLSALVIIFYFILSSCMYLQDSVLTFPPLKMYTLTATGSCQIHL